MNPLYKLLLNDIDVVLIQRSAHLRECEGGSVPGERKHQTCQDEGFQGNLHNQRQPVDPTDLPEPGVPDPLHRSCQPVRG